MTAIRSYRAVWIGLMLAGLVSALASLIAPVIAQENSRRGTILELDGPVTPPVADYLEREIAAADGRDDALVIIQIDTPGGLVTSMETIVKAMRASETPVVTFVAPEAARALSAGFYILYGSHVAAMAPTTTTGAATPVSLGGDPSIPEPPATPAPEAPLPGEEEVAPTEEVDDPLPADVSSDASLRRKVIESSVAYIRGLAQETGRNVEFAESAVREGTSITARDALEQNVVEIVARDLDDLLTQLDGRTALVGGEQVTISTQNILLERVEPTLVETILAFIADPNVAAILFSLGSVGLLAEIWNPGSIFPGVFGALCLALGFYSFQVLPADGLFLIVMGLGILLIMLEAFTPTFGIVGALGIAIFMVGLWFLYPGDYRVGNGTIIALGATMAALLGAILVALVNSRGHGPLIGQEAIKRREGDVDEWDAQAGEGYVIVDGERWRARSKDKLAPGDRIRVQDVEGIVLVVKKLSAGSGIARFIPGKPGQAAPASAR